MSLVALGLGLILLAGVAAVAGARLPVFRVLISLGAALVLVSAVRVLGGAGEGFARIDAPPPLGSWAVGVDALSALFLAAIAVVGASCAIYGVAYLAPASRRATHGMLALLIASLGVVVVARSAMLFLMAWEIMAVSAYFLIVTDSHDPRIRRAGQIYIVATHAGTLALFGMFAWWGQRSADFTFASLSDAVPALPGRGTAVLLLALFGFGLKAGLVPLHFWLPEAHAAAPSHVSALMSGIVIKMGIYGLLRVTALLGVVPPWWGWTLLAAGATSGVLGVVWALAQHDIKRLLAFHSVENIGIILLGMGIGALGMAYDHPAVAALGFAGAALHTLNHALFKSLLFLGAGSVSHAAGTRDIERLGGVARVMPVTGATFLIASIAIVGLPPLNGFVSEWMVFRSMLRVGLVADVSRLAVLSSVALALIGGLALACFAKVVGTIFLGTPRDANHRATRESPAGITRPLLVLAAACAAIGLVPAALASPLARVSSAIARRAPNSADVLVATGLDSAARSMTWLAIGLVALIAASWAIRGALARAQDARAATWGCGYAAVTPRMQYSASSFAAPLLAVFSPVAGLHVHRTAASFGTHAADPVLDGMIRPAWERARSIASRLRPMQRVRPGSHVLYVVAALLALLLYLYFGGAPAPR
jgi:formate hydrogenlyase subunit 3/multisubunit Na+/H+ antiporter MnhD subunit